jgi:exosortase O
MPLLANLVLLAAWVATHTGALAWIGTHYTDADRRLEALLLVGVAVLAWRRFGGPAPAAKRLVAPAAWAPAPLVLLAASLVAELTLARWLDLHLVRASAFVLGGYAIVGLYAPAATWRAGLPWVGLLTLTLPFGPFAEVYLGFPARLLTADLVREGLDSLGVASLSRDTILVLDRPGGRAAVQVDVPCAGVRSLWAGGVFLLAAACVEGRRLDRWFVASIVVTGMLLLAANTVRVALLVVLGAVLDAPAVAAAVHVPLGLVGFAWATAAGWLVQRHGARDSGPPIATPSCPAPALAPLLAAGLLALTTLTPTPPRAPTPALPFALSLPAELVAKSIAPIAAEVRYFGAIGVPPPSKWRFATAGDTTPDGTLLVVPSRAWRAHHQPTACLMGQGHTVEGPWTVAIGPAFAVRVARVDDGAATAVWWFQAPARTTEDLSVRTWAAIVGDEDRWVLVSLLLEGTVTPDALAPLVRALHGAVHTGLSATVLQETPWVSSVPS